MSSQRIPVGVVGVGHLGRHHARLYADLPGADLVGVSDLDVGRAGEVAREYGCRVFSDPAELAGKVRAASVAVPTVHHRGIAQPLLEAGVDVLVEKPIAPTLADADALLAASRRGGSLLMVGHTERFNPAIEALSRAVDAPRFLEIHRLAGFSARSTDVDVILDLMIHDLDLVNHLDGTEPVMVDAMGVAVLTDKLDIANARIRLASGCVVNLTASRVSAAPLRRIRVFQARTYLACDTARREVERFRLAYGGGGSPAIEHDRLPVEDGEPLRIELESFLDSVRTRNTPPVDGEQGRRALDLAFRVIEAMRAQPVAP